jgi:flagellar hook protein FlgE
MSFAIALSGINAASADLSTTANNVANANTTGFKSSRAEFADIFSSANGSVGTSTIGYGTRLSRVAQQFSQGSITTSSSALDFAISGEGFFTLSDNGAQVYTRAGAFGTDRNGYVVNASGQRLQVFPSIGGGLFNTSTLADLQLPAADAAPAATTLVGVMSNLPTNATVPATTPFDPLDPTSYNHTTSATVYDSLGAAHSSNLYFVKTATANAWEVYATIDGTAVGGATPLQYSNAGLLTSPVNGTFTLPNYTPTNGAADLSLSFDVGDSTQFGATFGVSAITQDGYPSGRLSGLSVTEQGVVQASYTNGRAVAVGQIALANFANPQGLQNLGDTTWAETFSSGAVLSGAAGTSSFGSLQSGALEASNVDLTAQLVNMITAQRNFQANAQMIQTSDAITQTIINLR